jgi:hypothetical protein
MYDGQSMVAGRYCKAAFFLALVIRAPAACFAAERYVFDVFDEERGLSNATVTRIAKDHQGFLWIAL